MTSPGKGTELPNVHLFLKKPVEVLLLVQDGIHYRRIQEEGGAARISRKGVMGALDHKQRAPGLRARA